ncbi:MAG TPA: cytochrome c oxidase assembly protein [Beijerinckiaceae bacterium]|jgi:cytochrome c oxidase assembly factor CtaG/cytochrome c2
MTRLLLAALACLPSGPAAAHAGHVHWSELGTTWTWDPWVLAPMAAALALYAAGLAALWRRAGVGRGVPVWRVGCFAVGWLSLAASLISPLHWLGERLFAAHMVEHEALMAIAAPALALARPGAALAWAAPRGARGWIAPFLRRWRLRAVWAFLTRPFVATVLHGAALWLWHAPALFEAALASPRLHWLQHVSFFATGLLFWWSLLRGPTRERGYGAAVFYLFATSLHTGFLGVLLSHAQRPLYPLQTNAAPEWGLTPLEDQQLAGLIMWVPGGLVYAVAALAFAGVWIARSAAAPPLPAPRATAARAASTALLLVAALVALGGCDAPWTRSPPTPPGLGDPDRGAALVRERGCGGCHVVPGVPGARGLVGPPLGQLARRAYIMGHLRNTPENLVRWIRAPQEVSPGNAMPDTGLDETQARDVAAFPYTLR